LPPSSSARLVTGRTTSASANRADRMVTTQDRMVAELTNLSTLMEVAQQSAQLVTPRTWSEMTWRQRIRWLRTTG
jgi:hypothetical protein